MPLEDGRLLISSSRYDKLLEVERTKNVLSIVVSTSLLLTLENTLDQSG